MALGLIAAAQLFNHLRAIGSQLLRANRSHQVNSLRLLGLRLLDLPLRFPMQRNLSTAASLSSLRHRTLPPTIGQPAMRQRLLPLRAAPSSRSFASSRLCMWNRRPIFSQAKTPIFLPKRSVAGLTHCRRTTRFRSGTARQGCSP
jgi:hypothetical protein